MIPLLLHLLELLVVVAVVASAAEHRFILLVFMLFEISN
jgi:hypothetical protein